MNYPLKIFIFLIIFVNVVSIFDIPIHNISIYDILNDKTIPRIDDHTHLLYLIHVPAFKILFYLSFITLWFSAMFALRKNGIMVEEISKILSNGYQSKSHKHFKIFFNKRINNKNYLLLQKKQLTNLLIKESDDIHLKNQLTKYINTLLLFRNSIVIPILLMLIFESIDFLVN